MATEIQLKSLIDVQVLQHLQDAFASEQSVSIAVFDEKGELLTSPSRHCPIPSEALDYLSPFMEFILTWPPNPADLGVQEGNRIFSSFFNGLVYRAILPLAAPNRTLGAIQVILLDTTRTADLSRWRSTLEGFSFNYISYLAFLDSYSLAANDRLVRLCTLLYEQLEALLEAGYTRAKKQDPLRQDPAGQEGGDIVTTPDHDIIRIDPAVAARLDYEFPNQLLGLNVFDAVIAQPDDRDNIRHFLDIRGELADYPLFFQNQSGRLVPAKIRIVRENLGPDVADGYRYIVQWVEEQEIQRGDILDLPATSSTVVETSNHFPGRIELSDSLSGNPLISALSPSVGEASLPDLADPKTLELFDSSEEPLFILDPYNRIVLWNPHISSRLNIPAPAVVGSDFGYLLVGESQDRWQQWLFNFRLDQTSRENIPQEQIQIIDGHGDIWTTRVHLGKSQIQQQQYITASLTSCRQTAMAMEESDRPAPVTGESFRLVLPSSPLEQMAASYPLFNRLAQEFDRRLIAIQRLAQQTAGEAERNLEIQDRTTQISQLCDQMLHQMNLMQYASSPITLRRRPVDIKKLFSTVTAVQQPLFSAPYLIKVDLQPELHPLYADSLLLQQAINLLIETIRSAMPEGGAIHLTARNSTLPDEGDFTPPENRTIALQIEVAYPVCHLAESALKRLFEPFSENQRLEWAAIHGIVRSHGGQMEVASDAMNGTKFRLYLPAAENEEVIKQNINRGTILIIDDETGIVDSVTLILQQENIEVFSAHSLGDGLRVLLQHLDQIDCILLDVMLPDMEAPESVLKIREVTELPIILTSGYPPNEEISAILPRCGAPFLQKSYRRNTLLKTVKKFLRAD